MNDFIDYRDINPPEPETFDYCDMCGGEIYVGDEYYDIEDMKLCEKCAHEWFYDRICVAEYVNHDI